MNAREVGDTVEAELIRDDAFVNFHGITRANIRHFLVDPYEATVDPDDCESASRTIWVVLHERTPVSDGYVVVFDSFDRSWGVAERSANGNGFIMVVGARTMFETLDAM